MRCEPWCGHATHDGGEGAREFENRGGEYAPSFNTAPHTHFARTVFCRAVQLMKTTHTAESGKGLFPIQINFSVQDRTGPDRDR